MNETLLLAFLGVTSVAVVLQMLMLAGMYSSSRKVGQRIEELSTQVEERVLPLIEQVLPLVEKARDVLNESAPAIQSALTNLTETSTLVREQAGKINESLDEIVGMARSRAGQANFLVERTMQRVDLTAAALQHAVLSPTRRLSALVEGVAAGVGEYVGKRKVRPNKPTSSDDEMFI